MAQQFTANEFFQLSRLSVYKFSRAKVQLQAIYIKGLVHF